MEIVILLTLILLNGAFTMAEIALVTARKSRMKRLIDAKDPGALAAIELGEQPTRFLSTLQIGITLITILSGIIGEATLAAPFALWMGRAGIDSTWSAPLATGAVVLTITYVSIVLGELVPKRIGQQHPEFVARYVAQPVRLLAALARPFVHTLAISTDFLLSVLGVKSKNAPGVTEEEIYAVLAEGSDTGVIHQQEHKMVRNLFRLDDRVLRSFMVPRSDITMLDATLPWPENQRRIEEGDHTRFPVVNGGLHDILGVVKARRLLGKVVRGETPSLTHELHPPLFVPDSLTGMELLENFRASGVQLAFVVDEYGEVLGIVTLKDVLEAVTGEFKPQKLENSWAVERDDGSWLLDGLIPIPELKDRLELERVPEEVRERYQTLSGMMMLLLGRMPRTSDSIFWENWKFEVVDIDGKRVDKVLASRIVGRTDVEVCGPGQGSQSPSP